VAEHTPERWLEYGAERGDRTLAFHMDALDRLRPTPISINPNRLGADHGGDLVNSVRSPVRSWRFA
jgi:hypothetical protein